MRKILQRSPSTSKSRSENLMNRAGLTKTQKDKVRREILFGNVVAEQLREKRTAYNEGTVSVLHRLVAGRILSKYKCNKALCNKVGLNKSTLFKYSKDKSEESQRVPKVTRKFENIILNFLERDDNSRAQPGKADSVKCGDGIVKQTRVLTDFLYNLYQKFLSENPECTVSFATFCRIRPKHVQLSAFISRSSCLCTKHQNMALTAKTLRKEGVNVSANPEVFVKENINREMVLQNVPDSIKVPQWKRIEVDEKGKRKHVMRIVDTAMTKQEFINHLETQKEDFSDHVNRVKTQYMQIRHLKHQINMLLSIWTLQKIMHAAALKKYNLHTLIKQVSRYILLLCILSKTVN